MLFDAEKSVYYWKSLIKQKGKKKKEKKIDAGNVSVWSNISIVKSRADWQADLDGMVVFPAK